MKKKRLLVFAFLLGVVLCFSMTACDKTLEQLQNAYGAILDGGGFEKGSSLVTETVDTTGEKGKELLSLLEEQAYDKDAAVSIFEIFVSKDGKEVQPNGTVKITIPAPFASDSGYVTFHIKDDNSVEELATTYADGLISFETDSFSYFVVAEAEKYYMLTINNAGGSGVISYNDEEQPNGYQAELTEGSKVTLTASPSEGYKFVGWFEPDGAAVTTLVLKETPVSTSATYEFTMPAAEYTVYAVFEEVTTYSFSAFIEGEGGYFEINGENGGRDYWLEKLNSGDTVSLKVVANAGYDFKGWYAATDIPEFISASAEYTFTVGNEDVSVTAVFEAKVTGLILDAANAGFTEGTATYTIGDENKPNPEYVVVSGATAAGNIALVKDTDYTIDLGGLDFAKAGTYTITYTYSKDATIKDTLTVEVVAPKYLFNAVVGTSGGLIYQSDTELPNGYAGEHEEGETVTLKAIANEGYKFAGWYTNTDTPELISENAEHTFVAGNSDQYVTARFALEIRFLWNDSANAGFDDENKSATVTVGDTVLPDPQAVIIYGNTVEGDIVLQYGVDYTIDLGGLDFAQPGIYTITYTYAKNTSKYTQLTITVNEAQEPVEIHLSYAGSADPVKYNGGRAAYVFKSSILNNGEACDISALGLNYEWRNHFTQEVVAAARDDTWDDEAGHFPSPAVVGVYDFVVYMLEGETKVDLLTLTRTIEVNRFALVDGTEGLSEYTCYTFIAKVGDRYFAMSNPFEGNSERAAIEVFPDENGIISLGEQYEYVFRPYDSYKVADNGLTKYRLRTGMGLNRTGNLILWDTGHIEYNTSVSADYTVTFTFGEDSTATVHAPYCGGTLRLVYDETTDSYLFTAKSANEDERPSYPVYLYGEYVEVVEPTETYDFYNKLSKAYDGEAVSFNIYKDVYICTENGDLSSLLKMEMGRFVWTDLKFNLISVGEVGEDGMTVTGPSDVGQYQLVFQTLEKGEEGMVWTDKAILHAFEIYEATTEI